MATGDSIVFDMSSESEGASSMFIKKDWLSILDNQNQTYTGNQVVIDTSQLANSNKFMNYREAYLLLPMMLTLTGSPTIGAGASSYFSPATQATGCDYSIGLKNWYGSIVHSLTLDYSGTTVIQQTPYIGMWNTFRLMTSLSLNDVKTQGASIGFFPDVAQAAGVSNAPMCSATANATFNNGNSPTAAPLVIPGLNTYETWNSGLYQRQQAWNFDPSANSSAISAAVQPYSSLISTASLTNLYKSYIFTKINSVVTTAVGPPVTIATVTSQGVWQAAISGIVLLRHLHPFFEHVPLLKGVFMKLTLNLNQSSVNFTTSSAPATPAVLTYTACTVSSPLGGVSPIMVASAFAGEGGASLYAGSYIVSLNVGKTCLNSSQTGVAGVTTSPLSSSVLLWVPAYSFNPVFEASYLSSPVKKIMYEDCYQYQVLNVSAAQPFNNLVTNGIANIKSVLILPFYNSASNGSNGLIAWQSPFDPAGGGPTSPLCLFNQFNVQISGQNAIYSQERYSWEQFQNQFYGTNAQNAGQDDGFTSGLVGMLDFDMSYCYYFVNCGRMLPVEEAVPKSINILGINQSMYAVDLYVFVSYGVEISIDILTGARVG